MYRYMFWQAPVPLGLGRPLGGLSFVTKALLQGKVFNGDLPDGVLSKLLFAVAWSFDLLLWCVLVMCMFVFYTKCIGGFYE